MTTFSTQALVKSTNDCVLAGVCGGIARKLKIESWIVRVAFLLGIVALGVTPFLYLIFAVSIPKENDLQSAYNAKVLGVCSRFAKKMNWDIAIVRSAFLCCLVLSIIPSFGTTLLIYIVMHFVLPEQSTTMVNSNIVDVNAKDLN